MAEQRKPNRAILVIIAAVHLTAVALTWRDLRDRPDGQVRGRKVFWRIASAVNTGGSAAYWLFGRKRKAHAGAPTRHPG